MRGPVLSAIKGFSSCPILINGQSAHGGWTPPPPDFLATPTLKRRTPPHSRYTRTGGAQACLAPQDGCSGTGWQDESIMPGLTCSAVEQPPPLWAGGGNPHLIEIHTSAAWGQLGDKRSRAKPFDDPGCIPRVSRSIGAVSATSLPPPQSSRALTFYACHAPPPTLLILQVDSPEEGGEHPSRKRGLPFLSPSICPLGERKTMALTPPYRLSKGAIGQRQSLPLGHRWHQLRPAQQEHPQPLRHNLPPTLRICLQLLVGQHRGLPEDLEGALLHLQQRWLGPRAGRLAARTTSPLSEVRQPRRPSTQLSTRPLA